MNLLNLFDLGMSRIPKYSINDLLQRTPIGYRRRSQDVKNITYLGYKIQIKKQNILSKLNLYIKRLFTKYKQTEVLTAWVRLYFRVESATYKNKFHTLIIEVPFRRDLDVYRVEELPIRYYCSCESFKFFIAYVLNRTANCLITKPITRKLGIALTKRPEIRNPMEIQFFCKHAYAVVTQIKNLKITRFLRNEYKEKSEYDD